MTMSPDQKHPALQVGDPWWKSAVVYQVYPRSFVDSDGDGIGDMPGIISKLDYLTSLGVDVLWVSPVYPGPQVDNGYDISDYRCVDALFGTLADVDELIARASERGIKIMMDVAVNHTSDQHPWFIESKSSTDNPKRDWYWWRPAREGKRAGEPGAEPTNWSSKLGGPAWERDDITGDYYLHLFSKHQPDLNWENPGVRAAMYEIMRYWLDRGIYGFRFDMINHISKVLPLRDSEISGPDGNSTGSEFVTNGPRMHEFIKEMRREVAPGPEWVMSVGEMPGVTVDDALVYTDREEDELDMVFHIDHMLADRGTGKHDLHQLNLAELKAAFNRWQTTLHTVGWNSLYWDNHDQPRIVSRFGDDRTYRVESAKMLATILPMMQGTPFIYQGEEIGMTNFPFTRLDQFGDIETRAHIKSAASQPGYDEDALLHALAKSSRENARTPMQWNDSENAGFTSGTPWMPVNPNAGTINASQAVADKDSVFHYYRRLIQLRHELPIVIYGDFGLLLPEDERIFAYTRSHLGEQLLVLGNFSDEAVNVPLENGLNWSKQPVLMGNYPPAERTAEIELRPWETRVYHQS